MIIISNVIFDTLIWKDILMCENVVFINYYADIVRILKATEH